MQKLLSFLMRREAQLERDEKDESFKTSLLIQDPQRYIDIFEQEDKTFFDPQDVQEVVPESPDEMAALLREMQRGGFIE